MSKGIVMNCEQAQQHFVDAWTGSLASDEAAALNTHLDSCGSCREEFDRAQLYWNALGALPAPEPGPDLRTAFYGRLSRIEHGAGGERTGWRWLRHPAFQAAAAVLLLAAGLGLGRYTGSREDERLAELRKEVNDMRQLVALSLLQQQSAAERLQGVSWAYRVEQSNSEVLTALLHTLNADPNVNVRLAAVDALRNFSVAPEARAGLVNALPKQNSPLVQIAILDQLVDLRDRSSVPSVALLMHEPGVSPEVRERAEWAVKRLQ